MAKRLFEANNFVITEQDGKFIHYQKKECSYEVSETLGYRITEPGKEETYIENGEITDWITTETGTGKYTEATLKDFLRIKTGGCCAPPFVAWGEIIGNLPDQTDLQAELDSKITDQYFELWSPTGPAFDGVWDTVILPGAPADRIVSIIIQTSSNNTTVGVRSVGSGLIRSGILNSNGEVSLSARTDALGQVEMFTSSLANSAFLVESYRN